jgi:hypothetical protein
MATISARPIAPKCPPSPSRDIDRRAIGYRLSGCTGRPPGAVWPHPWKSVAPAFGRHAWRSLAAVQSPCRRRRAGPGGANSAAGAFAAGSAPRYSSDAQPAAPAIPCASNLAASAALAITGDFSRLRSQAPAL